MDTVERFALKNWQASCQFNLAHKPEKKRKNTIK